MPELFGKSSPANQAIYAKAKVGEPLFIMLGRDPAMVPIIAEWITLRESMVANGVLADTAEERDHIAQARRVMQATLHWQEEQKQASKQTAYEEARRQHTSAYWAYRG